MRFQELLSILHQDKVNFIVIGGVAAAAHGAARATYDLDIVYERSLANLTRLAESLRPFRPYLRGAPPGLPFKWDADTLRKGLNFTLTTTLGDIDLLGEVAGGGTYEQLAPYTLDLDVIGVRVKLVSLERLIQLKRAAGRPKDLEAIAELQAILDARPKSPPQ